jgi:hypothetical protein
MLVEAVFNTGLHSVGAIFALLFTAVRILVWAFLVATAWYEIVEKPFEQEVKERAKNWKTTDPGPVELTETALDQHQAAEAVYKQENKNKTTGQQVPPARQRPGNIIPRSSGRSGMADGDDDESVDRWSIGENERELGGRGAPHFQPHTPPPAHHTPSEGLVAEPIPSVPETRYTGVNTNVVRPAVQVVALDEPTGGKKGSGSRGSAGKKHFINRKVEEYLVEPYEKQCMIHYFYFIFNYLHAFLLQLNDYDIKMIYLQMSSLVTFFTAV